jgi:transposase
VSILTWTGGEPVARQRARRVRRCGPEKRAVAKAQHRAPARPYYDHRRCRAYLRQRGIRPRIARRGIESSERLGRYRWTIERTGAWLGGFRRLRIRYERSSERFYALVLLACSIICFNALQQQPW